MTIFEHFEKAESFKNIVTSCLIVNYETKFRKLYLLDNSNIPHSCDAFDIFPSLFHNCAKFRKTEVFTIL